MDLQLFTFPDIEVLSSRVCYRQRADAAGVLPQFLCRFFRILHIVTDVNNVYHAQMNTEEMSELLRFVPEGQDVGHSLFRELRRRSASFSGSGATFRNPPSQPNAQGRTPPGDSTSLTSPACGSNTPPLSGANASLSGSPHTLGLGGGIASSAGHSFGRAWTTEALARQRSALHNSLLTASDFPECSVLTKTDALSNGLRAAIGVDWDLDFFEVRPARCFASFHNSESSGHMLANEAQEMHLQGCVG